MAEKMSERQTAEPDAESESQVLLVVTDVPEAEEEASDQGQDEKVSTLLPEAAAGENEPVNNDEKPSQIDYLTENEKKALHELKQLVREALNRQELGISEKGGNVSTLAEEKKATTVGPETEKDSIPEPSSVQTIAKALLEDDGAKTLEAIEETIVASVRSNPTEDDDLVAKGPQEVYIWGVKLLEDEKSDVILLKFLLARDFKVKEAFSMIKNTIKWRNDFGIDELLEEDFGSELERVVFMYGHSREGHPVCYNVYGEFQNKELYQKMFSDEDKRQKFLRWRIQLLEKSIRKLDFRPGKISTIVQINDLKNSPGPNRWELRQATNQALQLLQDNYPEFVAKQVFINVPWWYLALSKMISPFLTQRTKNKFVVASAAKSTEALLKYIPAEQIPTQYGGLSQEGDFQTADTVTEIIVKPSAKHIVEFPVSQECRVSWEARVVGWEVSYGAEFVPSAEDGYTIIIQKMRRIGGGEEQVVCNSYKVVEPGKLVVTVDNPTSKKKKLLYRFKAKASSVD